MDVQYRIIIQISENYLITASEISRRCNIFGKTDCGSGRQRKRLRGFEDSEPYVKLGRGCLQLSAPKGAEFSHVSYKKTESAKEEKKKACIGYNCWVMRSSAVWI